MKNVLMMIAMSLSLTGCRAPSWAAIEKEGLFQGSFGEETLKLQLEEHRGSLRGFGSLNGRQVAFQERPERLVSGHLAFGGMARIPVVLHVGREGVSFAEEALEVQLVQSEEPLEFACSQAGARTGLWRAAGKSLIQELDLVQFGASLTGEAQAFGRRFVLAGEVFKGGQVNLRLEDLDSSAFHTTGRFEGDVLTLGWFGSPTTFRKQGGLR